MKLLLLAILILSNPLKFTDYAEESVDLIELNHKYDKEGRHVFDQVIYWERAPGNGKYYVRAWHIVTDKPEHYPIKNYISDIWEVNWYDSDARLHRKIRSRLYRESWTQNDPEIDNKKLLPQEFRLKLIQRPKPEPPPLELTHP